MEKEKFAFLKKKSTWILVIIVLVAVGIFIGRSQKSEKVDFSSTKVEKIDLVQSVSETGSVVADLELFYGWETSGKVIKLAKETGDIVKKGELIAELENTKQRARLNEGYSALASAQARLDLELAGPTSEEKSKFQASVDQAQAAHDKTKAELKKTEAASEKSINDAEKALSTAENNLQLIVGGENSQIVNDAYDDLIHEIKSAVTTLSGTLTESDNILGVDNQYANDDYEDVLDFADNDLLSDTKDEYRKVRNIIEDLESKVISISINSEHDDVDDFIPDVQDAIEAMQNHLINLDNVLDPALPIGGITQTQIDDLNSIVSTEQDTVNTAGENLTNDLQAVTAARNSLSSYQIAYDKAELALENAKKQAEADNDIAQAKVDAAQADLNKTQASYDLLVVDPRDVDVASLRADVNRQAANVQALRSDLNKTKLTALSDGIMSVLDVEVGENVTANDLIVKIISEQLSVEVDISESDIAKVSLDDPVEITLDAFGEDIEFVGSVISIEPAETEISGVIYYKTDILFENTNGQDVRAGMTANIKIMTDQRPGVLVLPERAVIEKNGGKFIRIVLDKEIADFEERDVTVGLRGDNGLVEILTGVEEGQEVVTFIKE